MNKVSRESKILLFAGAALLFVGVPTLAARNPNPHSLHVMMGGGVALLIIAGAFLIAGLLRLQKDGAIFFPSKPRAPAPVVALLPLLGAGLSFLIIHHTGMLSNIVLTFWTFFVCGGLGAFAGLYLAGLRFNKQQ